MQKNYTSYVGVACKEGLKPEEVQNLFTYLVSKANTKKGKKNLKLFSQGIGLTKEKGLRKQKQEELQSTKQENTMEKSRQFIYK